MSSATWFLETLYGEALSGERRVGLFVMPGKKTRHFSSAEEAARYAEKLAENANVFFHVGLAGSRFGRRSNAGDIRAIPGLWADIDFVAPHRAGKSLPLDMSQAQRILDRLPFPPSMLVDSGYGVHPHWLFKEPWIFDSEEERLQAGRTAKGWHGLICSIAEEFGWHLENLGDLPRVLRLPGTFNRKDPENPVEVKILEHHAGRRYNPEDFEDHASDAESTSVAAGDVVLRPDAEPPAQKFAELLAASRTFARTWDRQRPDLGDQSQSGYDLSLATIAALSGWSDQEIANLIIAARRRHNQTPEKALRMDYIARTIAKARENLPTDAIDHTAISCGAGLSAESLEILGRGEEDSAPEDDQEEQYVALGERDPDTGKLVLSTRRTLPTARVFIDEFHAHRGGPTLLNYAQLFMRWRDNRFAEVEDGELRQRLLPWLHDALTYIKDRRTGALILAPFEANPGSVNSALESLRAYCHVPASLTPPVWIAGGPGRPDPHEILCCRSSSLHIPTGRIMPATPALFNTNALEFDYDPSAREPELWLEFLDDLWGQDAASIALLQEWMGYCLIADTSQQKMLMLVGPKRSGKGTIARVLARLVGIGNVCGPTVSSLAGEFGLQPLIGKSLGIISDARFTGKDLGTVVERLLCISGEDTLTVNRKHLPTVTLKLPTRLVFLSNELPKLQEASGALAGRFLVLTLTTSFFGRENRQLTGNLCSELPGILRWALAGWKRLMQRGYFQQPQSAEDAIRELEDLASPVGAFVRQCCVVGPNYRVWVEDLYEAWKNWCDTEGWRKASTNASFGRDLYAAVPGLARRRSTEERRFYQGLALRPVQL